MRKRSFWGKVHKGVEALLLSMWWTMSLCAVLWILTLAVWSIIHL